MIAESIFRAVGKKPEETLPTYCEGGVYPLVYFFADGEYCCPDCANGKNGSLTNRPIVGEPSNEDKQWLVVAVEIYYEGPDAICAHCGKHIASAYGDPNEEDLECQQLQETTVHQVESMVN